MRLRFLLVAVVLCGVCSAIPTDSAAAAATATASSSSTGGAASAPSGAGAGPGADAHAPSGAPSAMPARGVSPGGGEFDEDDDDDDEESSMGGGGLGLPLSSAILLSSHHGHHVCLPDVVAFSLLGGRGYPLGTLLPYHHASPQRLQQELMFLKAFTKAGQHVWKTIASGHPKHPYQGLGNIAKMAGGFSGGVNALAGKIPLGPVGIAGGIASGLSTAAQHLVPGH